MLLLAFDTATPAITVAVHDGARVVGRASGEGVMAHGEWLIPFVEKAMGEAGAAMADLTDVAVGVGPGPFTGLRVGVVTALTLGSTLGLTTHGVCTLDVIAATVDHDGDFLIATDARRKEVYWALYAAGGRRLEGPDVEKPGVLRSRFSGRPAYGRGAAMYDLGARRGSYDPDAGTLAAGVLSGAFAPLPLEPLYLRRPDATEPSAQKRA